jgi:phage virion morphogenesis protein
MTGATIKVGFQDEAFAGALKRLGQISTNPKPLLKRLGVALVDTTHQRFLDAKGPDGEKWQKLNPLYATVEKKGPGILRESAMRGGLMGSITFKVDGNSGVRIGSNKIYAAVHQFGAVIVPVHAKSLVFRIGARVIYANRVVIPARPYLGFGEADRIAAMEMVDLTWEEAILGISARGMLH